MAEVGAVLSVVAALAGLIKELIPVLAEIVRTATRGREECRSLKDELELIQSDVERIEPQLRELTNLNPDADQYLTMVKDWLEKLKEALEGASHKVHKLDSTSKFRRLVHPTLSKQIAAQTAKITKLAEHRMVVSLLLTTLLKSEQLTTLLKEKLASRNLTPPSKWRKRLCPCMAPP